MILNEICTRFGFFCRVSSPDSPQPFRDFQKPLGQPAGPRALTGNRPSAAAHQRSWQRPRRGRHHKLPLASERACKNVDADLLRRGPWSRACCRDFCERSIAEPHLIVYRFPSLKVSLRRSLRFTRFDSACPACPSSSVSFLRALRWQALLALSRCGRGPIGPACWVCDVSVSLPRLRPSSHLRGRDLLPLSCLAGGGFNDSRARSPAWFWLGRLRSLTEMLFWEAAAAW